MRKILITLLAMMVSAWTVSADGLAAAALKSASDELAASLVLSKLGERVVEMPADDSALYEAMASDTKANATRTAAVENMTGLFRTNIGKLYADEAEKLLNRLAMPDERTNVFSAAFLKTAETAPAEVVDAAVKRSFDKAFTSARMRVCEEQSSRLSATIRPDALEIESLPRENLSTLMTDRLAKAQETTVFEENLKFISESIVKPMLDSAYAQREQQRFFINRRRVDGIAPSVISSNLLAELVADICNRRSSTNEYLYGIFPSITNSFIHNAADHRARVIFANHVANAKIKLDATNFLEKIESDPINHKRLEGSIKIFEPVLWTNLANSAIYDAIDNVPAAEGAEFRIFATSLIKNDESVQKNVSERVRRDLVPVLKDMRRSCATIQFNKLFPSLADGEWFPSESLTDEICTHSDFRKDLTKWQSIEYLDDFAAVSKKNVLMEETEELTEKALVEGFATGAQARSIQHSIVNGLYETIKKLIADESTTPPVTKIKTLYTDRVKASWNNKCTENEVYDEHYKELFPSTYERIDLLSKTLLDAINKERTEIKDPEPQQPPPEELKEIEMNCVMIFDYDGDEICASVKIDGREIGSFSCPGTPKAFRNSVADFTSALRKSLNNTLAQATLKNRVKLTVRIDVRDGLIYYGAVSGVSAGVKNDVKEFGEYVTSLELTEVLEK